MNIQVNSGQGVLGASNPLSSTSGNTGISDAFRTELASILESTLERFGINANQVTISLDQASTTGQTRQNLVATSVAPALNSITNPTASPASSISTPETSKSTPESLTPDDEASLDDAYWAKQPAAVQQLRDIKDPDKRGALASQLAAEGYKIDVPIMMWGWDPALTTAMRQSFGYTWVPSAYQAPVAVAPGVSFPPMASYDPKNPPADSIQVG